MKEEDKDELWLASVRNEYAGVKEQLLDVFDSFDMLTGHILLLTQMAYRFSTQFAQKSMSELERGISGMAHAIVGEEPAGRKAIPPHFLDGRQFHVELEALEKAPKAPHAEIEWILDRLETLEGYAYCVAMHCVGVAGAYNVTVDSVVAVVCENVTRMRQHDETPEGQAELAGGSASVPTESFVKTVDACWGLMGAAMDHGPEGFLAYRDASAYLHSPSGWTLRKCVAEAEFDGERAPIRASVSAAFSSAGRCKWVTTQFNGSEQRDLVQVRDLVCETLARKHGKPTYAKRDIVEWAVEFVDARISTEVELEGFGNMWTLNVRVGMKSFW